MRRPRRLKKHHFTCEDVGNLVGMTAEAVRRLSKRRRLANGTTRLPRLNLDDLASVMAFIFWHGEGFGRVARAVLAGGGDVGKAAAELKVSRSTLYRRALAASRSTG